MSEIQNYISSQKICEDIRLGLWLAKLIKTCERAMEPAQVLLKPISEEYGDDAIPATSENINTLNPRQLEFNEKLSQIIAQETEIQISKFKISPTTKFPMSLVVLLSDYLILESDDKTSISADEIW